MENYTIVERWQETRKREMQQRFLEGAQTFFCWMQWNIISLGKCHRHTGIQCHMFCSIVHMLFSVLKYSPPFFTVFTVLRYFRYTCIPFPLILLPESLSKPKTTCPLFLITMFPFLSNPTVSTSSFVLPLSPQIAAEFGHHTHPTLMSDAVKSAQGTREEMVSAYFECICGGAEVRGHRTPANSTQLLYTPLGCFKLSITHEEVFIYEL